MRNESLDGELREALEACDELLLVCRAQQAAIASDVIDELNDLLDEREKLMASPSLARAIAYAGGSFAESFTENEGAENEGAENEGAESATNARARVSQKLREALGVDGENRAALRARLSETKRQIIKLGQARQALGNYAHGGHSAEPAFLDRRR